MRRSTADLGASGGVGLTLMAMLERSWLLQQMPAYLARRDETSTSAAAVVLSLLRSVRLAAPHGAGPTR
ncbi:hypothetical protein [Knoellia aerolata]|nr:hypothetical protein [Knoellia aerolata]